MDRGMEIGFTLGRNTGKMLHELSWSHLLDLSPEEAVSLWTDSFREMGREVAVALTAGKYLMCVEGDGVTEVMVKPRDEYSEKDLSGYPSFSVGDIIRSIREALSVDGSGSIEGAWNEYRQNTLFYLQNNKDICVSIELDGAFDGLVDGMSEKRYIPLRRILAYYLSHDRELPFRLCDCADDKSHRVLSMALGSLAFSRRLGETRSNIISTIRFVRDNMVVDDEGKTACKELERVCEWICTSADLFAGEVREWLDDVDGKPSRDKFSIGLQGIDDFLEGEKKVEKALSDFKPCPISELHDAGFIAPDGTYFGIDGEVSNLLHISMADAIMEYYGWEKPSDFKYSVDAWLMSAKGFVKVAKNWVLYDGYFRVDGRREVPITQAQRKAIAEYGNTHYKGLLSFGTDRKRYSVDKFMEVEDDAHIAEIFGL